jgi:NAD(P)-dependent dehydrogenase (short-subunit alcohol dehydrogenase family)
MFDYRSMFNLDGKNALVVGAASGLGQASALGLAAFGAHVTCADIDAAGIESTAQMIRQQGGQAEAVQLDMRVSESIQAALAKTPPVDILVSTPSINVRKQILEYKAEEFDRVVGLNFKGTFLLMQAVARGMAERKQGSIITFVSIRAEVVEPGQAVYAATKAAVQQLVRTLAAEMGPNGVRVNAIAPGVVETPLTQPIKNHPDWYQAYADKSALKRWAQPHELVGMVVYLASEASSYVTGATMFVDGGWTAIDGRFTPPL